MKIRVVVFWVVTSFSDLKFKGTGPVADKPRSGRHSTSKFAKLSLQKRVLVLRSQRGLTSSGHEVLKVSFLTL